MTPVPGCCTFRPQRITEALRRLVEETAVVRGRRRAVESTIQADTVATQDTITQLISTVRRVARMVPGAAQATAAVCMRHDYRRAGKPVIDWDEPEATMGWSRRRSMMPTRCWRHWPGSEDVVGEESVAAPLAMLALVAGHDVEPADGLTVPMGDGASLRKVAPGPR